MEEQGDRRIKRNTTDSGTVSGTTVGHNEQCNLNKEERVGDGSKCSTLQIRGLDLEGLMAEKIVVGGESVTEPCLESGSTNRRMEQKNGGVW